MDPFFYARDCLSRALERKKTLIAGGILFVAAAILGMCFCKSYAMYEYHLNLCNRFLDRVCYSNRSVFLIFLERWAGHGLLAALILAAGMHLAALPLAFAVFLYRAYTFGGSIVIFFTAYGFAAVPVVFVLYLPVHLLIDAVLLLALSLSCGRSGCFSFCGSDFLMLLVDFLLIMALVAAVCLAEAVLLLALFHPIGNIL